MGKALSLPLIRIFPVRFKTRKLGWLVFFFSFFFFFFPSPGWGAMSLTFSGVPLEVEGEEEFEVEIALLSAPKNRVYFLRAAFFQEGTSNYFGYTLNNQGIWRNEVGEYCQFLEINTGEEGEWEGVLRARADLEAVGFQGPGEYLFKVGRYTEGGSLSWSDDEVGITIVVNPSPSPTLVPTPTSTPTPTPLSSPATEGSSSPAPTVAPAPVSYTGGGIFLNEIMAYPVEGGEWVEIKNENDFEVSLVDWVLDDVADGGSRPLEFSLEISGGGLGVVYVGTRFNNSGDVVRLIGQSGEEIHSYPYASAEKGYSFARDEDGNWHLTLDPTPGEENKIVGLPSPSPVPLPSLSPTFSPAPNSLSALGADDDASPFPTGLRESGSLLGLSDGLSGQTATESGFLTDWMCPLVEELERNLWGLGGGFLNQAEGDGRREGDSQKRPPFWYFSLLGLALVIGSFGFFLKETGFLVKWWHGLVVKG